MQSLQMAACVLGVSQGASACAVQEPAAAPAAEVTIAAPTAPTAIAPVKEAPPLAREPEPYVVPVDPNAAQSYDGLGPDWSGNGVARPPPPPAAPISGTPAKLVKTRPLECPFPPEADVEKVDRATVRLVVRVDETGKPLKVTVLSDPGSGFGRAARKCLLNEMYAPGRDDNGVAVTADTPPITVRFSR